MKRQKQETILASFSRQQKPLVKRAKAATTTGGAEPTTTTRRRDLHVVGGPEKFNDEYDHPGGDDQGDEDDDADPDGSVTDVDAMSSQEDAVAAFAGAAIRSTRGTSQTDRVANAEVPASPEPMGLFASYVPLHTTKDVKDSVHGIITFEPICWRIIDTLQFQRLRNLHQLGAAATVYIGATHTRFEHCLGVAHLAEKMVTSIRAAQPYLPISSIDVLCIKLAGLCHDLGHGPFSHVFDGIYMKQLRRRGLVHPPFQWTHEQGSLDMFDHLLCANRIDVRLYGLDDTDVVFIKELIYGGPLPGSNALRGRGRRDQRFLYDFVNNAKSGLDVDKLDYFMRDARQTGAKASCDVDILIRNARVLVDREDPSGALSICYPEKLVGQIMQAFRTRFELHQTVYQHKHVRAAEYMLCDVMLAANDHIRIKQRRISEIVHDVEAYQHLDDRVLARIEESEGEQLSEARAIRERMLTRKCYDFVGSTTRTGYSQKLSEECVLQEVLALSPDRSIVRQGEHVIVEFVRMHYGKGADDPVQHVRFYAKDSDGSSVCYQLSPESYLTHRPQSFQDASIRVFVKHKHLVAAVREAFRLWCLTRNGSRVRPRTVSDD